MSEATISPQGRGYLRLQMTDGVGPISVRRLVEHFKNIETVFGVSSAALQQVEGLGRKQAESVLSFKSYDALDREIARTAELGLRILCPVDADYPYPLSRIADPPICLYVRGSLRPEDTVSIAVVGSRQCTQYGREQSYRFGAALAGAGFTVVSGLARGVDAAAQRGALEAGGRSIAVLGNGLATVYPPEHGELAMQIAARGAVLSELAVDTPTVGTNFPARNRIIAGLTLGTLVIEASHRSGACITARLANEYNREVFALPGRVDNPTAFGANTLIRDGGAKLVMSLEDILDELGELGHTLRVDSEPPSDQKTLEEAPVLLSEDETAVWKALETEYQDIDALVNRIGLPSHRVSAALTRLLLRGQARALGGRRFARR